jgi:hypothetical protein
MNGDSGSFGRQHFVLAIVVSIVAILAVANVVLFEATRALQLEVNARTAYLQQTAQVEPLFRELVQALAALATRNNDEALRRVLAEQGITFTVPGAPGGAAGPAPGAPAAPGAKRP